MSEIDFGGGEKTIRKAHIMLEMASALLQSFESDVRPSSIGKVLNMVAKTITTDSQVLAVILGLRSPGSLEAEIETPSLKVLNAQLWDLEPLLKKKMMRNALAEHSFDEAGRCKRCNMRRDYFWDYVNHGRFDLARCRVGSVSNGV